MRVTLSVLATPDDAPGEIVERVGSLAAFLREATMGLAMDQGLAFSPRGVQGLSLLASLIEEATAQAAHNLKRQRLRGVPTPEGPKIGRRSVS